MKIEFVAVKIGPQEAAAGVGVDHEELKLKLGKNDLEPKLVVPTLELWAKHTPKGMHLEAWAKNDDGIDYLVARRDGTAKGDGLPTGEQKPKKDEDEE